MAISLRQLGRLSSVLMLLGLDCLWSCADPVDSGVDVASSEAPPPPELEESDLYRLDGDRLYVHSTSSGLNVIDVSQPLAPRLVEQLAMPGRAGELYVADDAAFVLLEEAVPPCKLGGDFRGALIATTSQLVPVQQLRRAPRAGSPLCLPGQVLGSRKLGNFVYVVTSYEPLSLTWAFAIDVSSPAQLVLHDSIVMEGAGGELFASEQALYIAQREPPPQGTGTLLRYVSLDAVQGTLQERGSVSVSGEPAGRFHMDAQGSTLRIVTRNPSWQGSDLYVIDFAEPDRPRIIGELQGIARGEELHATRFEGDRAYVVTYEALVTRQDPLWVISLSDPRSPTIVGQLEIPGWSDYVFPRGQQLVAVGRGDRGNQVAVALFDVSDPAAPAELARVAFGDDSANSEANADFRAASIIDADQSDGLVVVPYTDANWEQGGCVPEHHVQLVELEDAGLTLRGSSSAHAGRVLRTLPIEGSLYTLGRQEVSALDISDRDTPQVVAAVDVAEGGQPDACVFAPSTPQWDGSGMPGACSIGFIRGTTSRAGVLGALALAGVFWARRRRPASR
jgi:hypothetical protein